MALHGRKLGPTFSAARIAIDVAGSSDHLPLASVSPETEETGGDALTEAAATTQHESSPSEPHAFSIVPLSTKMASKGIAVLNTSGKLGGKLGGGEQNHTDSQHNEPSRRHSRPTAIKESIPEGAEVVPPDATDPEMRQFRVENKISRHLSTFSLTGNPNKARSSQQQPRKLPRRSRWSQVLFKNTVSPEELLLARDPNFRLHRFTLRHDSSERYAWDVLVMVMILVEVVITPLSIGFELESSFLRTFNGLGSAVFAVDFFVQMFSSYTNSRGQVISGTKNTAKHYLLSIWALPDFLGWFPFEKLTSPANSRAFGISKVIRLAKVSQLARKLHSAKKAGILRFIRLLGVVFMTSHVLTCYWVFIADEWRLHVHEGDYAPDSVGGLYALSWSLIIGCLNASPPAMYSAIESVSVAVFMLIGNLIQASVFGSVAVLISSFDEEEASYNQKLITVYERCKFLGIPDDLVRRIRGYYENLWRETKSVSSDADSFINELSPALICEVKFQLYRDMLTQIPFLSAQKVSPTVIEMLILHLRTVIYMQDDVLIRKGEVGDWMGFIGSKGSVGVLDPSSAVRKIIRILRKGDYFGEMALLQRAKRSTTAVALSWVQIHVLCRADLDNVKDQYPTQAAVLEDEINKYMQRKVTYK